MQETIIQTKTCLHCQHSFAITDRDMEFYNKISPTFAGQKFQIPTPTLCPDCRQRRRLSFRNERNLYKRKCDASGKDIVTMYKPESDYKVYDKTIRWSDARDPMSYGREFDFGKKNSENFASLMKDVPHCSLYMNECENCDYSNYSNGSKKVYLSYGVTRSEDCLYSHFLYQCQDVVDSSTLFDCNHCFQCMNCQNCSNCYFCNKSEECFNSYYLKNCKNCSFCIACSDLENKQYCYRNQEVGKEKFEKIYENLYTQGIQYEIKQFLDQFPLLRIIVGSDDCSGDNIFFSKSCHHAYNIKNAENCNYISYNPNALESYDVDFAAPKGTQYVYEVLSCLGSSKSCFIAQCWDCVNMYYCFENQGCHDCFGCIGLRNKSYCIFNKQYSKEDYEKVVAKIISHIHETGERGEFFHPSLSPFGYNETVAIEYYPTHHQKQFPSSKKELLSLVTREGKIVHPDEPKATSYTAEPREFEELENFGYHRSDYQAPLPIVDKVIDGKDLPDIVETVSDDILKSAIRCEITGKLFRIIPQELAFYRKHHIPLPRRHPDQRHKERMELRK